MALDKKLLLRAIARALLKKQNMSYQELAETVSVSRRTLYRLAANRQALIEKLYHEAVESTFRAMERADLINAPIKEALIRLTQDFLDDAELYAFWVSENWQDTTRSTNNLEGNKDLNSYREQMLNFFVRGQESGYFKRSFPAVWLLQSYDSLLHTAASCRQNGTVALADISSLVIEQFLTGAVE